MLATYRSYAGCGTAFGAVCWQPTGLMVVAGPPLGLYVGNLQVLWGLLDGVLSCSFEAYSGPHQNLTFSKLHPAARGFHRWSGQHCGIALCRNLKKSAKPGSPNSEELKAFFNQALNRSGNQTFAKQRLSLAVLFRNWVSPKMSILTEKKGNALMMF